MQHLALDSTQINSWLECNRQYQLGFMESLIPQTEHPAFTKGKLVHRLLECYYTLKKTMPSGQAGATSLHILKHWLLNKPTIKGLEKEYDYFKKVWEKDNPEGVSEDFWALLKMRFVAYYSEHPDDKFQIISVEDGFSHCFHETPDEFFVLEGRIDLLVQYEGDLLWIDHKSQEREMDFYPHSVQFLNYSLATAAKHGMINYFGLQQNLPPKSPSFFRRQPIRTSQAMLDEWKQELITIYRTILLEKEYGKFPKNRHACKNGLNSICPFTRICEQTDPRFEPEIKRTMFKKREPWTPWRKPRLEIA